MTSDKAKQVLADVVQQVLEDHPPMQFSEEQRARFSELRPEDDVSEWERLEGVGVPTLVLQAFADAGVIDKPDK